MSSFVYLKMYLEGFVSIQKPGIYFPTILHTYHILLCLSPPPPPFHAPTLHGPSCRSSFSSKQSFLLLMSHAFCWSLPFLCLFPSDIFLPSPAPFLLTCVHTYVRRFKYRFCIGGKICGAYVFASGLFHLTKWSPAPSISLQCQDTISPHISKLY